jgi:hypothetical protein
VDDALHLLSILKAMQLNLDIPFPDDLRDPDARPVRYRNWKHDPVACEVAQEVGFLGFGSTNASSISSPHRNQASGSRSGRPQSAAKTARARSAVRRPHHGDAIYARLGDWNRGGADRCELKVSGSCLTSREAQQASGSRILMLRREWAIQPRAARRATAATWLQPAYPQKLTASPNE